MKLLKETVCNGKDLWNVWMIIKASLKISGYKHLLEDPDRLIYSIICDINGFKVGVAGLNSAWSSYGGDEDKANLWLGTCQIKKLHIRLKDAMLSIAISHHPPNWFTEAEDVLINRQLEQKFDFYLHGHEHQDWVKKVNNHVIIPAGALYGGLKEKINIIL